ncbi:MAG: UDP-N-acetylmuramoyl-tripeptide--D-alanyl-D-alanine ligase [Chloroflexota bacterium]|nr:MAG: UDP-N-acetylmuramoyl-tripeptide--D-alanyl-D-alanine ligase [Chloroflexota bacterium]
MNLPLDVALRGVDITRLPYPPDPGIVFTSIANDSRNAQPGALFIAIEAERDGHDFIPDARRNGAIGVVARRVIDLGPWLPASERGSFAYIVVDDPIDHLQGLAADHRAAIDIGVVGVVGSVGKTTAKDVAAAVLRRRLNVLSSPGNFNNEIGLPIALLELTDQHERAILEMGAYHQGEIAALCEIARPTAAIVTTIGPTHLESFGSIEAIEHAKGEIVAYLPETGLAILNGDDPRVRRLASRARCPIVWYGTGDQNIIRARDIRMRGLDGVAFVIQHPDGEFRVETPLIGRHAVYPCLSAAALAFADDFSEADVAAGIASIGSTSRLVPRPGRNGSTVLDDAYNAAPLSVAAALDVLADHGGRRVAILGDMLELGIAEEDAHRGAGRRAAATADVLWAVGRRARAIGQEAELSGLRNVYYADDEADIAFAPERGDLILVKGSRGMHLERVVERLVEAS